MLPEDGGGVDVRTQRVRDQVGEQQRPGVLDEVDGAPGDLGAEVLDVDCAGGLHARDGREVEGPVFEDAFGGGVDDGDAVVVAGAGAARDDALGFVDGGGGADFDGGGEIADGFLARWGESVGASYLHMLMLVHLDEMERAGGDVRGAETLRVMEDAILQSILPFRVQLKLNCRSAQWMARRRRESCWSQPEILRRYGARVILVPQS